MYIKLEGSPQTVECSPQESLFDSVRNTYISLYIPLYYLTLLLSIIF